MKKIRNILEKNLKIKKIVTVIYSNTYGLYENKKKNKKFLKNGVAVLERIDEVFKQLDIKYWLDFGTLLGAVRERDFIQHDDDLDFGVYLESYSEEKFEQLEKYGFKKIKDFLIDNGKYGREITYEYLGVLFDIFFYTRVDEKKAYYHDFIPYKNLSRWKTIELKGGLIPRELTLSLETIGQIEFKGKRYPVPEPIKNHLIDRYGRNFMIKNKNWVQGKRKKENIEILNDKIGELKVFD